MVVNKVKSNFHFDEMPVDDIAYKRTGGCFMTPCKGLILAGIIFALGCSIGIFIYTQTIRSVKYPITTSLQNYISHQLPPFNCSDETLLTNKNVSIDIKHYKIILHPQFNQPQPFSFHGTVRITFTPTVPHQQWIQLKASPLLNISEHNLFVYRSRTLTMGDFLEADKATSVTEPSQSVTSNLPLMDDVTTTDVLTEFIELSTESVDNNRTVLIADEVLASFKQQPNDETEIAITELVHDKTGVAGQLNITLGQQLRVGHYYIVKINFSAYMQSDQGFVGIRYDGDKLFAGTIGRDMSRIFPCSIDVGQKSIVDFSVYRPLLGMTSVASSALRNTEIVDHNWVIDNFLPTPPIDINTFGFGLLSMEEPERYGTNLEIYHRTPLRNSTIDKIIEIVEKFELISGSKQDTFLKPARIISIPNSRRNIVQLKHNLLFLSENYLNNFNENGEWILSREVEEQLLDLLFEKNNVSNNYDKYWLIHTLSMDENEERLFSDRFESMQTEDYFGGFTMDTNAEKKDISKCATAVKIKSIFFLEMMKQIVGADKFAECFREYCSRGSTDKQSFDEILRGWVSENETKLFDELRSTWASNRGYPMLTISSVNDELRITQTVFSKINFTQWTIPISLMYSHSTNVTEDIIWLNERNAKLSYDIDQTVTDNWFLVNPTTYAYYRVNYDENNWYALLRAIDQNDSRLTTLHRAVLADDAFNLAKQGYLNYDIVFQLIAVWNRNEREFLPWKSLLDNLQFVYDNSYDLHGFGSLKSFISKSIANIYQHIVGTPTEATDDFVNLLKKWACLTLNIPECIEKARIEFDHLFSNKSMVKTGKSSAKVTLCTAVQFGGLAELSSVVDYLRQEHRADDADGDFQSMLIESLGCTRDPDAITVYLQLLSNVTYVPFYGNIIQTLTENKVAKKFALEHVQSNVESLLDGIGGFEMIAPLIGSISTELEYEMFQRTFDRFKAAFVRSPGVQELRHTVEQIEGTLAWKKDFSNKLMRIDWSKLLYKL